MSEDCLFLNIYSPNLKGSLPVLFWMHGGAWSIGEICLVISRPMSKVNECLFYTRLCQRVNEFLFYIRLCQRVNECLFYTRLCQRVNECLFYIRLCQRVNECLFIHAYVQKYVYYIKVYTIKLQIL